MCRTIYYLGECLDTIGKLRAGVGSENVLLHGGYRPTADDNTCTCPVDTAAVARKLGVEYYTNQLEDYFLRPGDSYVCHCNTCGGSFKIQDRDKHFETHKSYMSFSGPVLVVNP